MTVPGNDEEQKTHTRDKVEETLPSQGAPSEGARPNAHAKEGEEGNGGPSRPLTPSGSSQSGDALASALEDAQRKYLYLQADFENYRKRMLRETEQAERSGAEKVLRDVLGVVDLMERALRHCQDNQGRRRSLNPDEMHKVIEGVELTYRELTKFLERSGVEFVGKEGSIFDPNHHEAVSHTKDKTVEAETVAAVLERGALYKGRLLKPARVVVAVPHIEN